MEFFRIRNYKMVPVLASSGMKISMKTDADTSKASEVVFHAMFGTYLDDLGILPEITNKNSRWSQRKDLNSVFLKRAGKEYKFLLPLYSDMFQRWHNQKFGEC